LLDTQGVTGSNPVPPITFDIPFQKGRFGGSFFIAL